VGLQPHHDGCSRRWIALAWLAFGRESHRWSELPRPSLFHGITSVNFSRGVTNLSAIMAVPVQQTRQAAGHRAANTIAILTINPTMTDADVTNITPLRVPSPPLAGEGPAEQRPRLVKDPTAAERQRRSRANRKRDHSGGDVVTARVTRRRRAVTGPVTRPAVTPEKAAPSQTLTDVTPTTVTVPSVTVGDSLAYAAAIALAGCAAWFSIKGMVVLFPGAPLAVVAMAIAMETAKLVTAGWLASRWRATPRVWRLALMAFVLGLAIINATGVYAQLVSAHVGERGAAAAAIETQDAELASSIEVATHVVADLDARVNQIDTAIAEATRRGRTTGAMSIMEAQRRARAGLVEERNREAGTLAALKAERASVTARGRQAEVDATPIRYVTELLGGGEDSERAIRWLIALMVLCCDPLAIALTAAASARQPTTV
jgi:hypothetical protein